MFGVARLKFGMDLTFRLSDFVYRLLTFVLVFLAVCL